MENTFSLSDREARLFEMGGAFIAVDANNVDLEALLRSTPGQIVPCSTNPSKCIAVYPGDASMSGCVAGWISDEE